VGSPVLPLNAKIILTGVNLDRRIEPWWTLAERRIPIIRDMHRIGIDLVTTPNFSVIAPENGPLKSCRTATSLGLSGFATSQKAKAV
jgi:hypothetical protein